MRLSLLFTLLLIVISSSAVNAQRITVRIKPGTLDEAFQQIMRNSDIQLVYNTDVAVGIKCSGRSFEQQEMEKILNALLANTPLSYKMENAVYIITGKPQPQERIQILKKVSGQVLDEKGASLPGAAISVKGNTSKYATVDIDGNFELTDIPENATLVVSFLGYETLEYPVNGRTILNIVLPLSDTQLDEVMVVAYGTQLRRDVTGSVASVSEFGPIESQSGNVMTAIQGRVPGLWVRKLDGAPGMSPDFVIRGYQANNFNNQPLIVIDGMIVDSKDNFTLANISPQDIKSIEILKDAASSAMYGSRGAMGVVQITTHKGALNRRPQVNFSAYYGIASSPINYRMLNNGEYETIFNEARNNQIGYLEKQLADSGLTEGQVNTINREITRYRNEINALSMGTENVNWMDELIPSSVSRSNVFVSLSGGSDMTTYYFSLGRNEEESSVGTGKFRRLSTKLALTNQTYKWLKLSSDISVTQNRLTDFIPSVTVLGAANVRPDTPYEPKIDENGNWGYYFGSQRHPLLLMKDNNNSDTQINTTGNFKADIRIIEGLIWTSTLAGTLSNITKESYSAPYTYNGRYTKGSHDESGSNGHRFTSNTFLNFNRIFGRLSVAATVGYEYNENKINAYGFNITGFSGIEGLEAPGNGTAFNNSYIWANTRKLDRSESYFARANVSFDNKYLLSVSIRRDGTSRLPKDTRYSNFPAISAGWIVSDEPFMAGQGVFRMLKLRSSYGMTGSIANINQIDTYDILRSTSYFNSSALTLSSSMANPLLKWEKTKQFDVGIDASTFNGKLTMTAEWYYKHTSDMVTSEPLPSTTGGFTTRKINAGVIRNRGLDLDLAFRNQVGEFTYETGMTININRSKVLNLPVDEAAFSAGYYGGGNSPRPRMKIGLPLGALQMYDAIGIDENGDMIYRDKDGSGSITAADMIIVSNLQPDFTGGLNASISWKGLSLFTQFAFTSGGKIYNCDEHFPRTAILQSDGMMRNLADYMLDRWTEENPNSRYPRYMVSAHGPQNETGWNDKHSTLYLFDASFLKLNKLTLSYELPQSWTSHVLMNRCTVFVSGENVFTLKNKKLNIPDPEAGLNSGIAQRAIPSPRSIMFGIDIIF